MLKLLTYAILLNSLVLFSNATAYDIRTCDSVAESDIEVAADFLEENMSKLVDRYTFLTERQRQEIVRKWARLKLRCSDKEIKCDKFVGYAHGGPGNRINICYTA